MPRAPSQPLGAPDFRETSASEPAETSQINQGM
ncbi:Uncharacterised protein [Legionella quateirensis]|uniref:Uncharacterized protein n=1 Tax=Legionella quateirensis TaxID=45072 RepID=A0A378KXV8_9GAMM|nr:Uncharacterised protein [Legionella quateirensis]